MFKLRFELGAIVGRGGRRGRHANVQRPSACRGDRAAALTIASPRPRFAFRSPQHLHARRQHLPDCGFRAAAVGPNLITSSHRAAQAGGRPWENVVFCGIDWQSSPKGRPHSRSGGMKLLETGAAASLRWTPPRFRTNGGKIRLPASGCRSWASPTLRNWKLSTQRHQEALASLAYAKGPAGPSRGPPPQPALRKVSRAGKPALLGKR